MKIVQAKVYIAAINLFINNNKSIESLLDNYRRVLLAH